MCSSSPLFDVFAQVGHYAVHVLTEGQEELARRFSDDNEVDRFSGVDYASGIAGLPLLEGTSTSFECEVVNRHVEGDHVILVGRVLNIRSQPGTPLVFHAGQYKRLQD